jgi:hypothetical protein
MMEHLFYPNAHVTKNMDKYRKTKTLNTKQVLSALYLENYILSIIKFFVAGVNIIK